MGIILSSNKKCCVTTVIPPTLSSILIKDGLNDIEHNKNPYGVARRLMENILQYRSTNIYEDLQFGFINSNILYDINKALFYAAKGYQQNIIKHFMTKFSDKYSRKKRWNNIMYGAAEGGHLDLVLHAISKGAYDIGFGITCAVKGGHLDIIKQLAVSGDMVSYYNVHNAAKQGRIDILEYFESINIENWNWSLCGAAEGGHLDAVKYTVSKGANDWKGALISASTNNHLHIIKYIKMKKHMECM